MINGLTIIECTNTIVVAAVAQKYDDRDLVNLGSSHISNDEKYFSDFVSLNHHPYAN